MPWMRTCLSSSSNAAIEVIVRRVIARMPVDCSSARTSSGSRSASSTLPTAVQWAGAREPTRTPASRTIGCVPSTLSTYTTSRRSSTASSTFSRTSPSSACMAGVAIP